MHQKQINVHMKSLPLHEPRYTSRHNLISILNTNTKQKAISPIFRTHFIVLFFREFLFVFLFSNFPTFCMLTNIYTIDGCNYCINLIRDGLFYYSF